MVYKLSIIKLPLLIKSKQKIFNKKILSNKLNVRFTLTAGFRQRLVSTGG